MSNKSKKEKETKLILEELRRENELLRLENLYLKKLEAYEENQSSSDEKRKKN